MKISTLFILASAAILGGCASTADGSSTATAASEETYTPLGSLIAKKGPRRGESGAIDLQSFDNNRTMKNSVNNSGKT